MANELNIQLDPFTQTGLTLLGKVFSKGGIQQGSNVSMTEGGSATYTGDFSLVAVSDGAYLVRFETNAPDKLYGTGALYVRSNAEISQEGFILISEYTIPDNVGITANGVAIGNLNDFDPSTDTVANVTLVGTTTTNTDMRGTDGANTVAPDNASITDILADTNELQTNQGNFATATGFATPVDVSDSETVVTNAIGGLENLSTAQVQAELVTYGANTVAPDNAGITSNGVAIGNLNDVSTAQVNAECDTALTDYDGPTKAELDTAESNIIAEVNANETKIDAIPTNPLLTNDTRLNNLDIAVSSRSVFNPATDTVARVTLVDTVTTNSDMRGTDSANTVVPDNTSIAAILVDTNDLQTNQGNFATATGFTVPADLIPLATSAEVVAVPVNVWAESDRGDKVDFIHSIEGGKWKIVNNQMIFYESDNSTEIARFNLFGDPGMEHMTERERV